MPKAKTRQMRNQVFSSALMSTMERNGVNQPQLSAVTGVPISRINNYLHGKYRTIRPDHLERIVRAACRSAGERSELIRSYLLDLLPEALHADILIGSAGGKGKPVKSGRSERSLLPSATAAALTALEALSLRNARARARVELFAEILSDASSA